MAYQDRSRRLPTKVLLAAGAIAGIAYGSACGSSPSAEKGLPTRTSASRIIDRQPQPGQGVDLRTPMSFLQYAYPEARSGALKGYDNGWVRMQSGIATAEVNLTRSYIENPEIIVNILTNTDALLAEGRTYTYQLPDGSKRIINVSAAPSIGREFVFIDKGAARPSWSNGDKSSDTKIYGDGRQVASLSYIEVDKEPEVKDFTTGLRKPDGAERATVDFAVEAVVAGMYIDVRNEEGKPYNLASEQAALTRAVAYQIGVPLAEKALGLSPEEYDRARVLLPGSADDEATKPLLSTEDYKRLIPPRFPGPVLAEFS